MLDYTTRDLTTVTEEQLVEWMQNEQLDNGLAELVVQELCKRYAKKIAAFARGKVPSGYEDDVWGKTIWIAIKAIKSKEYVWKGTPLIAYLKSIARFKIKEIQRETCHYDRKSGDYTPIMPISAVPEVGRYDEYFTNDAVDSSTLSRETVFSLLRQANFNDTECHIFWYRMEGWSYDAIGQEMNRSPRGLSVTHSRAMKKLREYGNSIKGST